MTSNPYTHQRAEPARAPLTLLRLVVTAHTLAVFAQTVLAGQYLSGAMDTIASHGIVALLVWLLALIQIPTAVLLRRSGRGPLWPTWASVLLSVAEGAQISVGDTSMLGLHVPLGAAIFGAMLLLLVWVWRPHPGLAPVAGDGREAGAARAVPASPRPHTPPSLHQKGR